MKSGKESTEHWRAYRAEILATMTLAVGVALAQTQQPWPGVALAAVGALLLGWVHSAYAASRGGVKAASERPRVVSAPRG